MCFILVFRARRSEARIQQMLWKVNYADIISAVCEMLVLASAKAKLYMLLIVSDELCCPQRNENVRRNRDRWF